MDLITIKGARTHNLKNIDISIPRNKLVVMTGISGSGKSSLAFDTLYAEGQRRYVESLSTYARQFLESTDKPDVDSIEGLSPAISIDQKTVSRNPRSTVGTITEIYDFMRLLFAKVGVPHDPDTGTPLTRQTSSDIVARISELPADRKLYILAPIIEGKKGEHKAVLQKIEKDGFIRMRVNGEIMTISEEINLDPNKKHTIEVIVDRLVTKDLSPIKTKLPSGEFMEDINPDRTRVADSVELALRVGEGRIILHFPDNKEMRDEYMSEFFVNSKGESINVELEPRTFSFNSPYGACPQCHGLGSELSVDIDAVIPNTTLTINEGAIVPWATSATIAGWNQKILRGVAREYEFDLDTKWKDLSEKAKEIILNGTGEKTYKIHLSGEKFAGSYDTKYEGVIKQITRRYNEADSDNSREKLEKYMKQVPCSECNGNRLKKEALSVKIQGMSIIDWCNKSIEEFNAELSKVKFSKSQEVIAKPILKEVIDRSDFLIAVGLDYLTLSRTAGTISGGEAQRIRLATQIGSKLQGVLYVLDEPSIGLHQRDNDRLIKTLENLRNLGNSVIVVEHDEDTMRASDWIVDIGPGAGKHGGQVIFEGTYKEIIKDDKSVTGAFLSGKRNIHIPKERRKGNGNFLKINGCTGHNLKNVSAEIPLGCFVGVTGVSGSGKSTLINDTLAKILQRDLNGAYAHPEKFESIFGLHHLDKSINIDQSPIGRTPRSNPATYTGVFTDIRDIFTKTSEARIRGYEPGRFSFNVKGGRCEHCQGDGVKKIEMHFLPDVYVTCEVCNGKRYNPETLEITYRGKNIADVLSMTVEEALEFFDKIPSIKNKMQTLKDVGLDYIQLGQNATTLSGGEAQRIKLATELAKRSTGKTFYILDEPTTGLHFQDVEKLLVVLQRLVDSGNTVLVIEHNLDMIKSFDYIFDMGYEGGDKGGQLIAKGTPEEIAKVKDSYTGQWLAKILK